MTGASSHLRSVAFYLPQFHPIPENDEWWGRGFTEWNNVAQGNPLFRGHRQPHIPADLGFYDLRVAETRTAQAELARRHGIDAFCYYHYWFNGRRVLERPFDEVHRSGEPDFPFLLCWANENWTRAWDGKTQDVLLQQTYSADDDRSHIRWLAGAFSDSRYLRVDDKPVFLVYKTAKMPDPARTAERWRTEYARIAGGELYLCTVQGGRGEWLDPSSIGFDAAVQFPPFHSLAGRQRNGTLSRAWSKYLQPRSVYRRHNLYRYRDMADAHVDSMQPGYKLFPGVTPGFDNSPRRPDWGATIITGSRPELYERWLREVVRRFRPYSEEENLVFVNAWNEWAEGNHLEPDRTWGRRYLEAHSAVMGPSTAVRPQEFVAR